MKKTAYSRCYEVLNPLTEAQQHDVLAVFSTMQQQNKIHTNATGLFISLAKSAEKEDLSPIPNAPIKHTQPTFKSDKKHPNIQWGYSQTPQNFTAPPMTEEAKQRAEAKAEKQRQIMQYNEEYNQLDMLALHCQHANITLAAQAKLYKLEHILEKFPKEVAAFNAKLNKKENANS